MKYRCASYTNTMSNFIGHDTTTNKKLQKKSCTITKQADFFLDSAHAAQMDLETRQSDREST